MTSALLAPGLHIFLLLNVNVKEIAELSNFGLSLDSPD
jgi:hypothetical protein